MTAGVPHPLAGTDWNDLLRRLTAYAVLLYRTDKVLPGTGKSPSDLVGEVIVQLLEGKIRYDGRRPLLPLLKKALYHDFLDMKKSASARRTEIAEATTTEEGEPRGGLDNFVAAEMSPPDVLFRGIVYEAIGDDQDLQDVACAILDMGASMPTEIAAVIGITVDEVENRRKRLRRVLAPVHGRLRG